MAKPWEKYGGPSDVPQAGPWSKYGTPPETTMTTGRVEGGAPPSVRAAVGAAPAQAQLPMVQSFFPGAIPDPVTGRTMYPDPDQPGQYRWYNPPGLDIGDIPSIGKEAAMTGAAAGGAVAGLPLGFGGAVAGSGLAAAGTQEAIEQAAMRARGVQDPRGGLERAVDIGAGGLGTAMGGGLGPAAQATAAGGLRRAFRGGPQGLQQAQQAIDVFGTFGATPTVGQATRNRALDSIEGFLSRTPGGAGPFAKKTTETTEALQEYVAKKSQDLSRRATLEPEIAGRTIQGGLRNWTGRFQETAGTLYDRLDQFVPSASPVSVSNTLSRLEDLAGPIEGAEALSQTALMSNPTIKSLYSAMQQDAAGRGLPYGVLKEMRSRIGRLLGGGSLVHDLPKKDLNDLYGAISEDMRQAAVAGGGEAAEQAWKRANRYYKSGLERVDTFYDNLAKKGEVEKVFTALERGGRDGATKIRSIRKALTGEEWNVVSGTALRRLGQTRGSQADDFSVETYLTNWRNLSPQARDAFFGGKGSLTSDLDKVANATQIFRENTRAFANPSGTAGQLIGQGLQLGTLISAATGNLHVAGGLATAVVGLNGASRLMTSPKFVRWLARATEIEPTGLSAHIGRLSGIAQFSDPELRGDILEYLQSMTAAGTPAEPGAQ